MTDAATQDLTTTENKDASIALPANLPEKFIDVKTGAANLQALTDSYLALEKKLSTQKAPPESPDAYAVDVSHGLFSVDPVVNQRLFDCGCSNDQVQEVYKLAAEKLVPAIVELSREYQADREVERLTNAFGGPEKWQEISRQMLAWGQRNLPPDTLANLALSYDGVMALHRLMAAQEPAVTAGGNAAEAVSGANDLRSMMRDPRYWQTKDPAFIAKVTEGFQKMYGG